MQERQRFQGWAIHLVGPPASGKSTLGTHLSHDLAIPYMGIEEERLRLLSPGEHWPSDDGAAWAALRRRLLEAGTAIVETSGMAPARDETLLGGLEIRRVFVTASPSSRTARLQARVNAGDPFVNDPRAYMRRLMLAPCYPVPSDLRWSGDWCLGGTAYRELVGVLSAWVERSGSFPTPPS
jgi:hypothetical protein